MRTNNTYRALFFIFHFSFFISCVAEQGEITIENKQDFVEVTFNMSLPESGNTETRAFSNTEEEKVAEIRIFMFDNQGILVHHAAGQNLQQTGNNLTCRILMYPGTYDVVAIANSQNWIDNSFPGGIPQNITHTQFAAQLTAECTAIWDTDTLNPQYFPMWGTVKNQNITLTNDHINGIQLLRAVAAIDITVENTIPGTFQFQSIHLYRNYRRGLIIPGADNWNGSRVTAPSLPTGGSNINTAGHSITVPTAPAGNTTLAGEIYIFDTPAGNSLTGSGADQNFCIVAGLLYNGTTSYYRIDFIQSDQYIPVLRNHKYTVTIKSVDRPGADSPEEALAGLPANIKYEITDTNKSSMNHIAWDGQHYLMANTDTLRFYNAGSQQPVRIQTSYPGGWRIQNTNAWYTVTPANSPNTTEETIQVTTTADPTLTAERKGTFTVKAGELSLDIVVVQSELTELWIETDPDDLIFYATNTTNAEVNVTRVPAATPYKIEYSGDIVWNVTPATPTTASTLNFRPQNNTSGNLLTGLIKLTIESTDGRTAQKEIAVRQYPGSNAFTVTTNPVYSSIEQDATFWILSSQPWYLRRSIPAGAATLDGSFPAVTGTAQEYNFLLAANNTYEDRDVTLVFSTTDNSQEYETTITQEGNIPTLTFNATLSNEIDIHITDNGPVPQDVVFDYNFPWRMTAGAGYNTIVQSMSRNTGVTYPVASISNGASETLRITPYDYTNQTDIPKAGTEQTTEILFHNYGTDPYATTQQGKINIKRTIQPVLDIININTSSLTQTLPHTGGTITITGGANAPWHITTSTGQSTPATSEGPYSFNTHTINIPANHAFNDPLQIEVFRVFNGQSLQIATYTQESYEVSFTNKSIGKPTTIGTGTPFFAQLTGNYPTLQIKMIVDDDGTDASDIITVPAGNIPQDITLNQHPNNRDSRRTLRLVYSPDGITWHGTLITSRQHRNGYYFIYADRYYLYSEEDINPQGNPDNTMTWAEGMGIDTYYNSWTYYNRYDNNNRENPEYFPTETTGCGGYSEPDLSSTAQHVWRLPTSTQMKQILKAQIEGEYDFGITDNQLYHTAYDEGLNASRIVWISGGSVNESGDPGNKSQQARIRCVREIGVAE